jgi:single-strand DNA-binding protein
MNFNQAIVIGRVTANPELRSTPSGQSVAQLGVATNRTWTDKNGQKQEQVEFHNVVLWGRQAETAVQFLQKGSGVLISGRLQTRSWQDKNGIERRTTEIICEHLQLGAKPQGKVESAANPEQPKNIHVRPEDAEDVPVINLDEEIKPEDIPF